jgi:hypothetical protein
LPLEDIRSCKTKPSAHGSNLAPYRYSSIPKSTSVAPQPSSVRKRPSPKKKKVLSAKDLPTSLQPVCLQSVLVSGASDERSAARGPLTPGAFNYAAAAATGTTPMTATTSFDTSPCFTKGFDYEYGGGGVDDHGLQDDHGDKGTPCGLGSNVEPPTSSTHRT